MDQYVPSASRPNGEAVPQEDLATLREMVMAISRPDEDAAHLITQWTQVERSPRAVVDVLKALRQRFEKQGIFRFVCERLHPDCLDDELLELMSRPAYAGGFIGFCTNFRIVGERARDLGNKAVRDLVALLRDGFRDDEARDVDLMQSRMIGLGEIMDRTRFDLPEAREEIDVQPIASALLERSGRVPSSLAVLIAGSLFRWQRLDEETYRKLYDVILTEDDSHLHAIREALTMIAASEFTPSAIIRRLVLDDPLPEIHDVILMCAAMNCVDALDGECREHIFASRCDAAIDALGCNLSGQDRIRAIRRIRELGQWPSAQLVDGAELEYMDEAVIDDLLHCPFGDVRATLMLNLEQQRRDDTILAPSATEERYGLSR